MNVLYRMNSAEQIAENNQHNAKSEIAGMGVEVAGTPRQNWLGEVAAQVTDRVKKWENWEKSPALRRSEEVLRGSSENRDRLSQTNETALEKKTGT